MRRWGGPVAAAMLLLAGGAVAQEAAGDPLAGRRLAGARCAVCHGNDGIAQQPDAPNLAGQSVLYTVAQLRHFRSGERNHEQMNILARDLTDAQIADLAAWYAAIQVEATVPGR
ncbi:c-type cytochrome [Roseicella aerolata]|uniref:Cytochrome c n=1 Tax=Roseicella aerolata TaxID=2883479 RepID=A0A9X1LCH3_9PROT|nr:cytochrome c [Roseicella aerolata]MCB4824123.1 cytochrome c [Roseicella aerolata]